MIKWSRGAIKWSTVYRLPWLDKSLIKRPLAIKLSTGDKMVYGLLWLDKTAIDLDKMAYGR